MYDFVSLRPDPWVLDFLEYSGHRQRDSWQAMIEEVLAVHSFVKEYGPTEGEGEEGNDSPESSPGRVQSIAQEGVSWALQMSLDGIAHLQVGPVLQFHQSQSIVGMIV